MANKTLFASHARQVPAATAVNEAGGAAYALSEKHALAQYAATGCFNSTFYATAEDQLSQVLDLAGKVPTDFLARTAVYCREHGFMKDVPAALAAVLASRDAERLEVIFPRVIDNAKMLRNFVQLIRSGVTGRRSLGSMPKRLVRQWLDAQSDAALFRADVGNDPSLVDIIKMVHPKPKTASREALYGYLLGRPHNAQLLPEVVHQFEAFKKDRSGNPPDVPFQMLTALDLETQHWTAIARRAGWQMTRMNLNTFARHGVFGVQTPLAQKLSALLPGLGSDSRSITQQIADRLRNPELIRKARCFPYQLMNAFNNVDAAVPHEIREALQDAMEVAVSNVPAVEGQVYVLPDVSGSMGSAVTGYRKGATSSVRCIDVAALVAAAVLRSNRSARVIPFEQSVVHLELNPRDSVMTNAKKLASIGGGGTNCSAPLAQLNREKARGDLVIYVSDNESWMDRPYGSATATMAEWQIFKQRNPQARLVCLDIQPYATTQAAEREDILNIGGFSDSVFDIIAAFANGTLGAGHWVGEIEKVQL
jgi:60 kDa SS-A/Ro ribonucleoprotein